MGLNIIFIPYMNDNLQNKNKEFDKKESILGLVVYSPVVYMMVFLVSFLFHLAYPAEIINGDALLPFGIFFMILAPVLIIWSQKSIKKFIENEIKGEGARDFTLGPYKFSRNPTYVALTILTLGFSLVANSLPMLFGTIVAFYIVNMAIVRREEELMHKKYGNDYVNYKTKVRPWV